MATDKPTVNCLFCAIVSGEAPSSLVYRNELVVAFLDVHPMTRGHTLIVPVRHRERLDQVSPSEGAAMVAVAQRVARATESALGASGANLLLSDGGTAGQEVPHSHLHVVPRYTTEELAITVSAWSQPSPSRDDLDAVAVMLIPASSSN
jgi:diadenosine tetraphosphate (Ap4A) HIT family hydrolase